MVSSGQVIPMQIQVNIVKKNHPTEKTKEGVTKPRRTSPCKRLQNNVEKFKAAHYSMKAWRKTEWKRSENYLQK